MVKVRKQFNLTLSNETSNKKVVQLKFTKPPEFKTQLNQKKMRVVKFATNNTNVPLFIPKRITSSDFYNFNTGVTGTTNTVDGTLDANSLKYFIIFRELDNSDCALVYLKHVPEDPSLVEPSAPVLDDSQYYLNPYYYYHRLQHFFSIIENTINTNYGTADCRITINPTTPQSFTFYFNKTFTQNTTIEFSEELIRLFAVDSYISPHTTGGQKSYVLKFSKFEQSSGTSTLKSVSCPVYEKIFPFTELLINSDNIGVYPTSFLENKDYTTNGNEGVGQNTLLAYNIRSNEFLNIYDYYQYTNLNDSLWCSFYDTTQTEQNLTFQVYLRLRNNIVIPLYLNPDELFSMTLELELEI